MVISADPSRQYGPIEQIRGDHISRYRFAAEKLKSYIPGGRVLDAACGCGYGTWMLHQAGFDVTGVDISSEAISYAEENYKGPRYIAKSVYDLDGRWDALVTFETLEHLDRPENLLLAVSAQIVIASVPNENRYPFIADNFKEDSYPHLRHYTPDQFESLLETTGHPVVEKYCQRCKVPGDVEEGTEGLFLIYVSK